MITLYGRMAEIVCEIQRTNEQIAKEGFALREERELTRMREDFHRRLRLPEPVLPLRNGLLRDSLDEIPSRLSNRSKPDLPTWKLRQNFKHLLDTGEEFGVWDEYGEPVTLRK